MGQAFFWGTLHFFPLQHPKLYSWLPVYVPSQRIKVSLIREDGTMFQLYVLLNVCLFPSYFVNLVSSLNVPSNKTTPMSLFHHTALTSIFRLLRDIRNLPKDSLLLCIPVRITTGQIKTFMKLVRTNWKSKSNHSTEKDFAETKQSLVRTAKTVQPVPCGRRQDRL